MSGSDPRAGRDTGERPPPMKPRPFQRFRGTTPDDSPQRPPRPALVELATALLIVNGFVSFFTSVEAMGRLSDEAAVPEPLLVLVILIGPVTLALGIALRYGHAWLLGLNVVAVAAFLELTSGTIQGLLFGGIDLFVVVVLLSYRPWFQWTPEEEGGGDRSGETR